MNLLIEIIAFVFLGVLGFLSILGLVFIWFIKKLDNNNGIYRTKKYTWKREKNE